MQCRKVRPILRYHVPNQLFSPIKFAIMCCFHFICSEMKKKTLTRFPSMYQNKLQEEGVQDVVNMNIVKSEPFGDLVD